MKMLVCIDGSKQSAKAVEAAVKIAGGCNVNEVSVIYVYKGGEGRISYSGGYEAITKEDLDLLRTLYSKEIGELDREESKKVLLEAKEVFEKNNIEAKTIFKEGHPAETIADVANEEGYDTIVIGSRGLGGLKRLFLGSVSNAVLQLAKVNVLVVK